MKFLAPSIEFLIIYEKDMKNLLVKLLLSFVGADEVMFWKRTDTFKCTLRNKRGDEMVVINTSNCHNYINLYKNNCYETSLRI